MVEIKNGCKSYKVGDTSQIALDNINLKISDTGLVVIYGESGSGKTTLLNCISKLDEFDSGEIKGVSKTDVAYIFQDYALLENVSIRGNLNIAYDISDKSLAIEDALKMVNIKENIEKKVNQLSGGQKQRIAIARALVLNRKIIVADEPTGNLDSKNSNEIAKLLSDLSKNKLVIVVTHNKALFESYADRMIELIDGKIVSDTIINSYNNEVKSGNLDMKLSWQSVKEIIKCRKKLSVSRIFTSTFILSIILLIMIISVNFLGNNQATVIKNATDEYNNQILNMNINNSNYIDDNQIDLLKSKYSNLLLAHNGSTINIGKNTIDVSYVYETNVVDSKIKYGINLLNDNEIIVSNLFADKYRFYSHADDISSIIGDVIIYKDIELKIVGVEDFVYPVHNRKFAEGTSQLEDLELIYFYINPSTYKRTYEAKGYSCSPRMKPFSTIYDSSIDGFSLRSGRMPSNSDEIVLKYASAFFDDISEEELLNTKRKFQFMYKGSIVEIELLIVGFGNENIVYNLNNSDVRFVCDGYLSNYLPNKVAMYCKDINYYTIKMFNSYDIYHDYYLSENINLCFNTASLIGIIISLVSILLIAIVVIYLNSFINQNIEFKKRDIGILKTFGLNNFEISKIVNFDTYIMLGLSTIISLILGPISIAIINEIFSSKVCLFSLLKYKWVFVIIVLIIVIFLTFISSKIALKKLNKRKEIDLIYNR